MLRRIAQAIPLNGAVVETLMRAHIANGDPAGARSVYAEHAAALLQEQLGEPAESIEQLRPDPPPRQPGIALFLGQTRTAPCLRPSTRPTWSKTDQRSGRQE